MRAVTRLGDRRPVPAGDLAAALAVEWIGGWADRWDAAAAFAVLADDRGPSGGMRKRAARHASGSLRDALLEEAVLLSLGG